MPANGYIENYTFKSYIKHGRLVAAAHSAKKWHFVTILHCLDLIRIVHSHLAPIFIICVSTLTSHSRKVFDIIPNIIETTETRSDLDSSSGNIHISSQKKKIHIIIFMLFRGDDDEERRTMGTCKNWETMHKSNCMLRCFSPFQFSPCFFFYLSYIEHLAFSPARFIFIILHSWFTMPSKHINRQRTTRPSTFHSVF